MSAAQIAVDGFLAGGVFVELLCCLGVLAMRTAFDRLHYLGPAVIFGPLCFWAAIAIAGGPLSQQGVKAFIILLVLLVTGPILSYATARLIRHDREGKLELRTADRVQRK
jgi:multisubunit Na+/H+ antiporter MnhG subunit